MKNYFKRFNPKKSTKGWYRFNSPFISTTGTMGVNFDFNCVKCFKTGYLKSVELFIMDLENCTFREALVLAEKQSYDYEIKKELGKPQVLLLPIDYIALNSDHVKAAWARSYLRDRGFEIIPCMQKGMGVCVAGKYDNRLIIPCFANNELVYFFSRTIIDASPKYLNPDSTETAITKSFVIYNEDALFKYDTVYLTEGFTDTLTIGDNCIATLGWSLSDWQIAKISNSGIKELIIVADKGFFRKAIDLAFIFWKKQKFKIKLINFDDQKVNDATDLGRYGFNKLIPIEFNVNMYYAKVCN